MQKIDKVVLKETAYIAVWVLIFSTMMQAVFLIIGKWDHTVLLGNIYSGIAVVLNYLSIGLSVQKALSKEDSKDAKQSMRLAGTSRMLTMFIVAILGVVLDIFNTIAVVIPLLFPRLAIFVRPLCNKVGVTDEDYGVDEKPGSELNEKYGEDEKPDSALIAAPEGDGGEAMTAEDAKADDTEKEEQ